jgi:hypothetical protein
MVEMEVADAQPADLLRLDAQLRELLDQRHADGRIHRQLGIDRLALDLGGQARVPDHQIVAVADQITAGGQRLRLAGIGVGIRKFVEVIDLDRAAIEPGQRHLRRRTGGRKRGNAADDGARDQHEQSAFH